MKKLNAGDPDTTSPDFAAENLARLRTLFPELVTEGPNGVAVNVDVLKQLVGDRTVTDVEEKYGLNWHGKRQARQLALTPSAGTLRPCPDESVDWDTTQNLMIEGDNLEVLKLLQKSYSGKVKLIYIDPPYNTGRDFVYPDDFRDNVANYLKITGQAGDGGGKVSSNTEASGRFHTDWLNMMYPRLKLARNLLRPDGVIFVSIDDHEVSALRSMCDEILGEENFLATLVWQHSLQPKGYAGTFSVHHNFILVYQRGEDFELASLGRTDEHNKNYSNPDNDPRGPWRAGDVRNALYRPNLIYPLTTPSGRTIAPPANGWRWSRETMAAKIQSGEVVFSVDESRITRKIYLGTLDGRTPETLLFGKDVGTTRDAASEVKELFDGVMPFDTPKPCALVGHLIALSGAEGGDVLLDFFAGSGTSAQAAWEHNSKEQRDLRVILVQLPETLDKDATHQRVAAEVCDSLGRPRDIVELTKERLRRAGKKIRGENPLFSSDVGFRVFKLDSSNIKAWDSHPADLSTSLESHTKNLKPDRSEQDVLAELLLKLGLELTLPIATLEVKCVGSRAHLVRSIGEGSLLVCLSEAIDREDVEPLSLRIVEWHRELSPAGASTVVFRDSAFVDDVAKSNLAAILEQNGLGNLRCL